MICLVKYERGVNMRRCGGVIYLRKDEMERLLTITKSEIEKRDQLLEKLHQEIQLKRDGRDIIIRIPNVDFNKHE